MTKLTEMAIAYLQRELKRAQIALDSDTCAENAARLHEVDTINMVLGKLLVQKPVFTVERMTETAKLPVRAHPTDAGWDIFADEDVKLFVGRVVAIKTGLKLSIPEGWEVQVRCRGSIAMKGIVVANSPGTVDSGYRGEIKVLLMLMNPVNDSYDIWKGDKIAQLIFSPTYDITLQEGEVKQDSDRNSNAFGSTGK